MFAVGCQDGLAAFMFSVYAVFSEFPEKPSSAADPALMKRPGA